MLPLLESILTKVNSNQQESPLQNPTAHIEKGRGPNIIAHKTINHITLHKNGNDNTTSKLAGPV